MMVKLDMAKAFDWVSWRNLDLLLQRLGFSTRLVQILINNLRVTRCSILINGKQAGFFPVGRGVKQGDPLSPLLFILSSEGFSRGLNALMSAGTIKGFAAGRVPCVSHLGFADDLLVFLNGAGRNLERFRNFLASYQNASGQLVNYHKSQIVVGKGVSGSAASAVLGIRLASLPIKYLGSFLYKGINRSKYCTPLINHFEAKSAAWSNKLLSMAGRVVLIKHVLSSMPTHIIASSRLPKKHG